MNRSDWKLLAMLSAYNALTFGLSFGAGLAVSGITGSAIAGWLAFGAVLYYIPRADSLL
jgi:hypothetical protein